MTAAQPRSRVVLLTCLILVLLAGLPIAVWLDVRNISEHALRRQTEDLTKIITSIRGYYASNVVARVLSAHEAVRVVQRICGAEGLEERNGEPQPIGRPRS
jgi:hypothetical protein